MAIGRPFQKGQSGNPSGRPKIEKHLRELLGGDLDAIAKAQACIAQGKPPLGTEIRSVSAADATRAAEWVYDRLFGKPKQHVDLGGELNVGPPIDMSKLSKEQLLALAELDVVGEGDGRTEH